MDEKTRAWMSGAQPSLSPSSTSAYTPPPTMYTATALKTIGQKCSERLPPASAVQAMFLYEMQRQTEEEQLFKNQMFRLARTEDASTMQERRIKELETNVVHLEKVATNKGMEERLATSKSTMQMLTEKVNGCLKRMDGLEAVMQKAKNRIEGVERGLQENKTEAVVENAPESKAAFAMIMKGEIDVLFQDRDAMLIMMNDIQERLASLEASTTANTTVVENTASHPATLTYAAPVSATKAIHGVSSTNGPNNGCHWPDQTRSAVEPEVAVADNEVERQLVEMEAAEKAEQEREKASQEKRAKEKEAAKAKEAQLAAEADDKLKRQAEEAEEHKAARERECVAEAANSTTIAAAPPHLRPGQARAQTISLTDATNGSRPQTQRLPVQTASSSSAAPLDLSIPKGAPHVGLRASVHAPPPVPAPSNLRSFSPGKPWAS